MTIKGIEEIQNPNTMKMKPIKEKQDIYIPGIIDKNIPNRNGFIYILSGSGGSGKTSLMLNMFKSKNMYRGKFHNIFYICPMSSFLSVDKHPFEHHDKVYHELTVQLLQEIYNTLLEFKLEKERKKLEKGKKKTQQFEGVEIETENNDKDDDEPDIQYSCVIIDDMADSLKDMDILRQLNKMLIKARHLCCSFIFTLQSYYYYPKILRKQLTNVTIFKPKNTEEFMTLSKELMNMKQDDALTVFDYVFDEPYTHLDINTVNNTYYKNWNKLEFKT
jgi:hypothetical protein